MPGLGVTGFELQGHRGAQGLRPENTLPSFEAALDAGVTSIETDVHLSADGVPVLCHDPFISERTCRLLRPGAPPPAERPFVATLVLEQLRCYCADGNDVPWRFPNQQPLVTPVAQLFALEQGFDPYVIPTLQDLFRFVAAYAGPLGEQAGKTARQRQRAARLRFDLELKRLPFHPQTIGDDFTGHAPALLERRILELVEQAQALDRTTVRSFDHRCVLQLRRLEPRLRTAVLMAETAPLVPAHLVRQAEASYYCPCYLFINEQMVHDLRREGIGILPWTVNEPMHWGQLLRWGVSGITTDFPDALAAFLEERGVSF
jgi:glycerophosphoryl diester phosphodiesterase